MSILPNTLRTRLNTMYIVASLSVRRIIGTTIGLNILLNLLSSLSRCFRLTKLRTFVAYFLQMVTRLRAFQNSPISITTIVLVLLSLRIFRISLKDFVGVLNTMDYHHSCLTFVARNMVRQHYARTFTVSFRSTPLQLLISKRFTRLKLPLLRVGAFVVISRSREISKLQEIQRDIFPVMLQALMYSTLFIRYAHSRLAHPIVLDMALRLFSHRIFLKPFLNSPCPIIIGTLMSLKASPLLRLFVCPTLFCIDTSPNLRDFTNYLMMNFHISCLRGLTGISTTIESELQKRNCMRLNEDYTEPSNFSECHI